MYEPLRAPQASRATPDLRARGGRWYAVSVQKGGPHRSMTERGLQRREAFVTVVIPTRDRPAMLADAVASVVAQEDPPAGILVVNDGSRRVATDLPDGERLHVVDNRRTPGAPGARNTGLAMTETPWIVFLDDDDLWDAGFLEAMTEEIRRLPETAVAVGSGFRIRTVNGTIVERIPERREVGGEDLVVANRLGPGSFVVCRTDAVRRVGGFDEELPGAQDWDLWLRLAGEGRIFTLNRVLGTYRVHDQDQISCASPSERYGKYRPFFEKRERHPLAAGHRGELADEEYWWGVLMGWTGDDTGALHAFRHALQLRPGHVKARVMAMIVRSRWRRVLLRLIYGRRAERIRLEDRMEPLPRR